MSSNPDKKSGHETRDGVEYAASSPMWKRLVVFSPFIGGLLGAVGTVLVLVLMVKVAPLDTKDLLSFVLSTVTIVIAAFTVLGAVIVVMTWNDIDERTGKIVAKYAQEAKTGIEEYRKHKEAELDENARVRQEAINQTGQQYMSLAEDIKKQLNQLNLRNTLILSIICACAIILLSIAHSKLTKIDQWENRLKELEQSQGTKVK